MPSAPASTIRRGSRPRGPVGPWLSVVLWPAGRRTLGVGRPLRSLGVTLVGWASFVVANALIWPGGLLSKTPTQQPSFAQQWNAAQQARAGQPSGFTQPQAYNQPPPLAPSPAFSQTGSMVQPAGTNPFLQGAPSTGLMPPTFGQTQPMLGTPPGQIGPPPQMPPQIPPAVTGFGAPVNPYSQYAPPTFPAGTAPGGTVPAATVPGTGSMAPGVYFAPPTGAVPTTGVAPGVGTGVTPSGAAVSGFDPFAAPVIPPGYPNLPAPQSSMFSNPFVTAPTDAGSLFADPQSSGYWSGGQLNNPYSNSSQTWSAQSWQRFWQQSDWQKLWHAFRMRHTYIQGDSNDRVQINDTEIATSLSFPNFLGSQMPLTISPGFIFHNWQGPNSVTGNDLPGSAYSAYLSFDHSTPLDQQLGGEFNFTTGVYSDFDTFTQHSLRFTGVGLLWYRLSPTSTLKFGVEYLDRVEIKLLPAGGLFWTPDPNTRLSFYFPRPKFAKRFPNFGNTEVWGYVSGEYGGGSWTVQREAGFSDQVDLNDIRVTLGLEWIGVRGITGFGEFGYAFERQLIYRSSSPADTFLGSAILFRGGFAY